jgi:hypothetical protein
MEDHLSKLEKIWQDRTPEEGAQEKEDRKRKSRMRHPKSFTGSFMSIFGC